MAIIDELRTPLYFGAGTADLAVQQAKKVPGLIEQLAAEAPARIEAVRNADPKAVQEKVTAQAKEAQATVQSKLAGVVGGLDTDLKKLGETAQDLALRGVGVAAEYAVKAREKYEEVAAHGEEAVKAWRGEVAEEIVEIAVVVEPDESKAEEPEPVRASAEASEVSGVSDGSDASVEAKKAPARKTTARKAPAKKATVAAEKE
ncbi:MULTISPECIES: hypothetical protein [Streptomyces]|uniref:Heparin binding hemagglutinin HbhA n=1 Tax=Streptomyces venezuelae (strain ATCC 10712 / CBS 650.69 / DSM 40230 / JCM 4526 / NBRC 13096 / PD 04745) TaxID=953739 RepID=F2RFT1_STRVP|nr:hypothetical protein [Streptomyces venezuelae]APE22971.1 hypothetical protein vnz_19500 [Streptomyces venezuelae]QES00349.1 hypothetical protein DEJ43_19770 [Streptomyces venezuelae ATCC 10712]CCA57233.1 hypothetical protein SVEN_3947 [Streptomyces venezuelae ATCC 10712]